MAESRSRRSSYPTSSPIAVQVNGKLRAVKSRSPAAPRKAEVEACCTGARADPAYSGWQGAEEGDCCARSYCEHRRMSARGLRIVAVLGLALGLAACGFRPLYGRYGANPGAQRIFASIYIPPIEGERVGYQLRNSLIDLLEASQSRTGATYQLSVFNEARQGVAVTADRLDHPLQLHAQCDLQAGRCAHRQGRDVRAPNRRCRPTTSCHLPRRRPIRR